MSNTMFLKMSKASIHNGKVSKEINKRNEMELNVMNVHALNTFRKNVPTSLGYKRMDLMLLF